MIAKKIQINSFGKAEVMQLVEHELLELNDHEVLIRQTAVGFNYLDLSQRAGHMYKLNLPSGLGHEAAGVIEAVGKGVADFVVGERVAYMNAPIGAYANYRNIPAEKLVKIPDNISDVQAASILFKGLTAQYLVNKTYPAKRGDIVLIHAAAGNVGQILCSWAKSLGAYVIGSVTSEARFDIAKDAGCDMVINQSKEDWHLQLLDNLDGKKVNVVFDSVGKDTFMKSLDCIKKFGTMIIYGASSGPAPAIDPEILNQKGCLYLTRPSVFAHNATTDELRSNAKQLFEAFAAGYIKLNNINQFKLEDIVNVHNEIEARRISGSIVFTP